VGHWYLYLHHHLRIQSSDPYYNIRIQIVTNQGIAQKLYADRRGKSRSSTSTSTTNQRLLATGLLCDGGGGGRAGRAPLPDLLPVDRRHPL
jgi:hypothetical protein